MLLYGKRIKGRRELNILQQTHGGSQASLFTQIRRSGLRHANYVVRNCPLRTPHRVAKRKKESMKEYDKWEDITSYSRGDEKRKPKTFEIRFGHFRTVLHWNTRWEPKEWLLSVYGMFEQESIGVKNYEDILLAQEKALLFVEKYMTENLALLKKRIKSAIPGAAGNSPASTPAQQSYGATSTQHHS